MITNLRTVAALATCLIMASGAWASSPQSSANNALEDAPAYSPSSVTASADIVRDGAIVLTAADEPVAADAAASEAANPGGCDSCNAGSPYACCCPPLWEVSVGAVYLHRNRPAAGAIIGASPAGSPAFTSGSDFNFGWNAGPDVTIARRIGDYGVLEARYFNSYGTADVGFVTPGSFIGAGFIGPGGTAITGHELTKLDSTEINWRRPLRDQLSLLIGFRCVELKDDVSYQVGAPAHADYNYNNHLYGGQFGADWALTSRSNPLQIEIVAKAGVYENVNDGGVDLTLGGPAGSFSGQSATTAFVGEVDFSTAYIVSKHIAIHGGYQLLWLSDVALATDAANRSLVNPNLLTSVGNDGRLFYQGASAGIDFVW